MNGSFDRVFGHHSHDGVVLYKWSNHVGGVEVEFGNVVTAL
jgi:hypothetical protein